MLGAYNVVGSDKWLLTCTCSPVAVCPYASRGRPVDYGLFNMQLPTNLPYTTCMTTFSLQVLALQCCALSEPSLVAIALCCPKLQFLLLGGSSIEPPPPFDSPPPAYATRFVLPPAYKLVSIIISRWLSKISSK